MINHVKKKQVMEIIRTREHGICTYTDPGNIYLIKVNNRNSIKKV